MREIATQGGHEAKAEVATLRVRQSLELRNASRNTSALTRPLLLYYSALNLVRGVLLTLLGDIGGSAHGLSYQGGSTLFECKANLARTGTFRRFLEFLGLDHQAVIGKRDLVLRDVLAGIPELYNEFPILKQGRREVARVRVEAFYQQEPAQLYYEIDDVNEDEFREKWPEMLYWMKDACELGSAPFSLRLKTTPANESEAAAFCREKLMTDLAWRDTAIWYDEIVRPDHVCLPRPAAYLAALYILSNVCRYEPELLEGSARESTNANYFMRLFLDAADQHFPQLILSKLYKKTVYFI